MNFAGKFIITELRGTIFEVRHYLSKTLQLFTKSTIGHWMVHFYHLSLTCRRSIPHRRHTKKAVIPTPGLFIERNYAVSFNNLCRKYREPDLHCINKKTGIPTLFRKKKTTTTTITGDIVSRKALDFSHRLPWERMVADKKNKVFKVLVIWVNHLIGNCVCVCVCVCVEGGGWGAGRTIIL